MIDLLMTTWIFPALITSALFGQQAFRFVRSRQQMAYGPTVFQRLSNSLWNTLALWFLWALVAYLFTGGQL